MAVFTDGSALSSQGEVPPALSLQTPENRVPQAPLDYSGKKVLLSFCLPGAQQPLVGDGNPARSLVGVRLGPSGWEAVCRLRAGHSVGCDPRVT